jgi:hypothetical protein
MPKPTKQEIVRPATVESTLMPKPVEEEVAQPTIPATSSLPSPRRATPPSLKIFTPPTPLMGKMVSPTKKRSQPDSTKSCARCLVPMTITIVSTDTDDTATAAETLKPTRQRITMLATGTAVIVGGVTIESGYQRITAWDLMGGHLCPIQPSLSLSLAQAVTKYHATL